MGNEGRDGGMERWREGGMEGGKECGAKKKKIQNPKRVTRLREKEAETAFLILSDALLGQQTCTGDEEE